MIDAATYDLNRYLAQQDRDEFLTEEAERLTAENLTAAIAGCQANDEQLGEALATWLETGDKNVRLALAIRMALGMAGCTAQDLYLREIVSEAAAAWGADNHTRVDEDDVHAQLEDERAGL